MLRPCCQDPANRVLVTKADDKQMEQCKVCNAKHYEFTVDPIEVGITGADLNGPKKTYSPYSRLPT